MVSNIEFDQQRDPSKTVSHTVEVTDDNSGTLIGLITILDTQVSEVPTGEIATPDQKSAVPARTQLDPSSLFPDGQYY